MSGGSPPTIAACSLSVVPLGSTVTFTFWLACWKASVWACRYGA